MAQRVSVIIANPEFSNDSRDEDSLIDVEETRDMPVEIPEKTTLKITLSSPIIKRENVIQNNLQRPITSSSSKNAPCVIHTVKIDQNTFHGSIKQFIPQKRARKGPAPKLFGIERCTICSSKATGFHYNVLSCEGCKNFFRRAIIKGLAGTYHCKTGNQVCCVNFDYRPRCQWCRLDKCYRMGMRAEYINRTGQKSPVAISNALPERVANLIDTVKRSWEAATEGVEKPSLPSYLKDDRPGSEESFDMIPGIENKRLDFFLEMAFFKTKRIIKFMNFLPGVHTLSCETRIWLFKESLAESMVMFNATTYDSMYERRGEKKTEEAVRWLDGIWRGKTDFYKCGLRMELVEPMFKIWGRINELKLDKSVCSLLMVLILINPDRQIPAHMKRELKQVYIIQEQYIEALQLYFEKKYRRKAGALLGNSMGILSNLRDISAKSLEIQLSQLQKMECQMPELLARLFSYDNSIDIIGTSSWRDVAGSPVKL